MVWHGTTGSERLCDEMPESVPFDVLQRVIIIGNSGSGKSALAASIGRLVDIPVITLDTIHWEGVG
jgi:ABC-type dipeptide/oligopeptide/nickel transport system ATPase component